MKKILLAGIFGLVCSTSASATVVEKVFENADPTNWRLQTYTSATYDTVATFFTPSLCVNGSLSFPSNVVLEKTRYWDTVMAAKLSKKRMAIYYYYDNVANTCTISSYWLHEPIIQ
jgi:5-keto 4-deoxyuronate isomerase